MDIFLKFSSALGQDEPILLLHCGLHLAPAEIEYPSVEGYLLVTYSYTAIIVSEGVFQSKKLVL